MRMVGCQKHVDVIVDMKYVSLSTFEAESVDPQNGCHTTGSQEYDGYDDVYGHSVEDDYTISPSDAAFMYDRNRQPQMAAFMNEEDDIAEVDESELDSENAGPQRRDSETYHRPELSEIDEARLRSCLDEIRNVLGETVSEQVLVETVLKNEFNVAKALDDVLSNAASTAKVEDPHSKRQRDRRDIGKDQGAKRPAILAIQSEAAVEFSALNLSQNIDDKVTPVTVTPSIKVVPSGTRTQNVTKGFNVTDGNESLKTDSNCPTPRSGSPSSGRATPAIDDSRTPRNREKNVSALYAAERGDRKDQLHMVVIGHVDAGKSTLMGHLLYSLGQVNKKTMHKYEQESKKIGKQSFVYAWILDETGEERSRGVTMDVGHSQFETATKSVTLLDAPGHKDFIPNMITGATQADVAFLVVDATRGEFETGFESGGQTREHTLLVRSLGVSQLGVAVNKMETVGWSQDRFDEIVQKLGGFLKQAGFRERDVKFVPCSGLTGENLVAKPTEDLLNQWYNGPCLLDVIDGFAAIERPITKPFRLSVNDIFKGVGSGFSVSGRVETGAVQVGDRVLVQPLNEPAQIKALLIDEIPAVAGYAGDQISLTLAGVDMANVAVGNILCDPAQPIPVTSKFEARIVVFNIDIPITKGCTVILHHQSLLEQAVVTRLVAQLHKSSGEVVKRRPRCLVRNSTALVEITTARPVGMELYQNVKELGRFMLRVGGITVAAGLVTKIF